MLKGPPGGDQLAGLPVTYFAVGRRAEADAALARLIREGAKELAFEVAETYAYRGELTQAFDWLDRAYEQRDSDLTRFKGDPLFRNLEPDPRYKAFLRKMNLPE
jgi:adenylate cyclase